jgi:hypothetical protein
MSDEAWKESVEDWDGEGASPVLTDEDDEEHAPVGTLFFMTIFLLVMVGLWVTVYLMLLSR